jgi:transcriptional regulator with XRE-family HTH domain
MGVNPRLRPKYLAAKLLQIRRALGLSQSEMLRHLGVDNLIGYKQISKYETNMSEPPLIILLEYARVAGVQMEVLADDKRELPARLK